MAKKNDTLEAEISAFEAEEKQANAALQAEMVAAKPRQKDNVNVAEVARRSLKSQYVTAEQIPVTVSPLYRPYFGEKLRVSINGFAVYIPCDGKPYPVSKPFAAEAMRRIAAINDFLLKKERRADIQHNLESSPGELPIV